MSTVDNIISKVNTALSDILSKELELYLDSNTREIINGLKKEKDDMSTLHNIQMEKLIEEYKKKEDELVSKEMVLDEKIKETTECFDANKKVSMYQKYEKTIASKNDEIRILNFKVKSLEEQLRKCKEKFTVTSDDINDYKISDELVDETSSKVTNEKVLVTKTDVNPEQSHSKTAQQTIDESMNNPNEEIKEESDVESEVELEWVVVKGVNYLTDDEYLYKEEDQETPVGYKTKKGNWKMYKKK